ncbi:MAG: amino acid permease [Desulfobacca sp.]|uniref:amino acid permease n=1 Tax=Desulfobacca sp. TaxID=2067990 RepID=UPI00404929C3
MDWQDLVRKKDFTAEAAAAVPQLRLSRCLNRFDLIVLGVAQIIGAGIFVIAGVGVQVAGPGILLSFLFSGLVALLAAVCYAEMAAMQPVAGGAYSYAYAIFGEVFAWIIGWDLILEYGMGAATAAVGWSFHCQEFLRELQITLPAWAASAGPGHPGGMLNLPAALIVLLLTVILILRTRTNALVARVLVFLKVGILVVVALVGMFYVKPENWLPLVPKGGSSLIQGASLVFFAYLGFDVVAVTAEEARDPQRDVPWGIIGSLFICTTLYFAVTLVLVGMAPYEQISVEAPFSKIFKQVGLTWMAGLVGLGALGGITSVLFTLLLSQPRILFAMGRDGLLPPWTARLHPRFQTPHLTTLACGAVVAACAAFTPIEELAYMCNIGTLFAFFVVCLGVFILRWTRPDTPRPFRIPAGKLVSFLGALASLALMLSMPWDSWIRLLLWLALGLAIYFGYRWRRRNR